MRYIALNCFLLFFPLMLSAQIYTTIDANRLRETKWRYSYMLHSESGMILHKAANTYQYYLYFRFDQTYQQMLNGSLSSGLWLLNDQNKLSYTFQDVNTFKVINLDADNLVLEFERPNSKGHFQYFFINADDDNPFPKPPNELPTIKVKERKISKLPWWVQGGFKGKNKTPTQPTPTPTYISIELVGGGYSGGVDPVTRDYIRIKTDGRLVQEYQSKSRGLVVTKKDIPREELEHFCEFVVSQNFFEFKREYDCEDQACETRKHYKPTPIPLRLSIAYGNRRKVVSVMIWGLDERKMRYVNYPPALDNIIDAIQKFAHR